MNLPLPYDTAAELGIIGCCLLGGLDTATEAMDLVGGEVFSRPECLEAFRTLRTMVDDGTPIDSVSFNRIWSASGHPLPTDILTSADSVGSVHNLKGYSDAVNDCHARRQAAVALYSAAHSAVDAAVPIVDTLAQLESALDARKAALPRAHSSFDVSKMLITDLERRAALNGELSGVPTGFIEFDKLTDGLQFGEQTLIAARPSAGKTAIGINIVEHACLRHGFPTLFVSLEMSSVALHRRLTSSYCKIPMWDLKRGKVDEESATAITSLNLTLKKTPFFYLDCVSGIDIIRLSAAIRRHIRKHGIKLVIIDYLQKIRPAERQEKKTYEIGDTSGKLRALAVSTGAAFLTMAQLNREPDKDKGRIPRLADLADSSQIERDADGVAMLHRPRTDSEGARIDGSTAKLIVNKQRDGETGSVDLIFDGRYCRFQNASKISDEDVPNCRQSNDP